MPILAWRLRFKMLKAKKLMLFFENSIALNDLSIEIQQREIVGLLGSNSAGKTSLMNVISGLIIDMKKKETRRGGTRITLMGELYFDNEDILNMEPNERVKRGIVLSQERHPIFKESDVLENFNIAGYLRKRKEIKETIDFVFNLFPALKSLKKRKAGLLSGGEQQMLSIGMALIAKPSLLLMDEPFLGLSPLLQSELVKAVKEIRSQGITVLVSEQFARPLMPIIDRGYVIESGMLVFKGTGKELMSNPEVKSAYMGI